MAIPNIVPRNNNDGETLGTHAKQFSNVHTKDVTVNDVSLVNKLASIDSSLSSNTSAIASLSSGKADKSTTYTKTEVDTSLSGKADKSTTYTKTEVDTSLSGKVNKSGDTMTGDITMSNGVLKKASANGEMILFGGSTSANGAYLALRGLNHTDNGDFVLLANNGTSTTSLIGNANGELSWAGNVIPTQRKLVNSARASKFTIGKLHIEQGTYVLNATTTYADITFSNAFSSTPAILFGNEDAVAGTPMCTNLSATGFRLKQNVDGVARINWCAIGYRE